MRMSRVRQWLAAECSRRRLEVKIVPVALFAALSCIPMLAKGTGGHGGHSHRSHVSSRAGHHFHSSHSVSTKTKSNRCVSCSRGSSGRIKRSSQPKTEFMRSHPCPSTGKISGNCPGYIIDHTQALKSGGTDTANNMEWQSTAAARAKDKIE